MAFGKEEHDPFLNVLSPLYNTPEMDSETRLLLPGGGTTFAFWEGVIKQARELGVEPYAIEDCDDETIVKQRFESAESVALHDPKTGHAVELSAVALFNRTSDLSIVGSTTSRPIVGSFRGISKARVSMLSVNSEASRVEMGTYISAVFQGDALEPTEAEIKLPFGRLVPVPTASRKSTMLLLGALTRSLRPEDHLPPSA